MLGRLKYSITRGNKEELKKRYLIKIIIISIVISLIMLLLIFNNAFSYLLTFKPNLSFINKDDLVVHTLDVGQGLCIVIEFPNDDIMMFDTGTESSWSTIEQYLDKIVFKEDKNLDYLVLSHTDTDHTGSALAVLQKYTPAVVYVPDISQASYVNDAYLEFYDMLKSSDADIVQNYAGLKMVVGTTSVTWLAPNRDYYASSNDYSVAMLVQDGEWAMIVTADTGHNHGLSGRVDTEAEYISYASINNIDLDVDVLYAGHHGSKYSTSAELLDIATPECIIVPVGENTYGHPSQEFYERVIEYDKFYNSNLYDNIYTSIENENVIISVTPDDEYAIHTIPDVHNYIFIEFYVLVIIINIPLIYILLDAIFIYRKINQSTFK